MNFPKSRSIDEGWRSLEIGPTGLKIHFRPYKSNVGGLNRKGDQKIYAY